MSVLIGIAGDTGSGKSSSIQSLDPKTSYVINVAGKELPFKGSSALYNLENKNYKDVSDPRDVLALLKTISEKALHVKTVVIEDANYLMGFMMVDKATETGYTKFSLMAQYMKNLIQGAKELRADLTVVYMSHYEEIEDGGEIVGYKLKTAGKLIDKELKLDGLFTVVLYAVPDTEKDKTEFVFYTNRWKKFPAKSPMGMFKEIRVKNNLKEIVETVSNFYK